MSNTSNARPIPLTEIREVIYATEINNLKAEVKRLKNKCNVMRDALVQVSPGTGNSFMKEN